MWGLFLAFYMALERLLQIIIDITFKINYCKSQKTCT